MQTGSELFSVAYETYKIIEVKGQKVGIIGIANDEVKETAKTCDGMDFKSAKIR